MNARTFILIGKIFLFHYLGAISSAAQIMPFENGLSVTGLGK
jgi:hypothetical protein